MSSDVLPENLHPSVRLAQQVQAQGEGHVQLHNPLKNGPEQDVLRNDAFEEVARFDDEDEYETPDDVDSIIGSDDDIGTDDETGASDDEDDAGDDQAVPNDETVDGGNNPNFAGDGGGNDNIADDPRNDVNPAKVMEDRGDVQNMSESSEEDPMSGLETLPPDFSCFSGMPSPRPKFMQVKPPHPTTPARKNRIKAIIADLPCNRVSSPPFKHAVKPKKLRIPLKPAAVKHLISSSAPARDHWVPPTMFSTPKKAPPEKERDRRARPAKKARWAPTPQSTETPQLINTRRNRPLAGRPLARKLELPTTEATSTRRIEAPTYHPRQESWNKLHSSNRSQLSKTDEDGTKAPPSTPRGKKAATTPDLPQNGGNVAAALVAWLKNARRSLRRTRPRQDPQAPPSTPRQSKSK